MDNSWTQISQKQIRDNLKVLKYDEIMYIPLLEILKQLLSMDFVLSEKCRTLTVTVHKEIN